MSFQVAWDTFVEVAGQYTDAETGFVYLRARYYDPATGQFLTRDPLVAQTRSAYGYVNSNPLNFTDPSGRYPGEGLVDDVGNSIQGAVHTGLDVVATLPYGLYYGTYNAAKAINDVGCNSAFGPVEPLTCAVSHLAAVPLVIPEAEGLALDVAIDRLKIALGLVPANYMTCDEGQNVNLLPRQILNGGPTIHNAPGVRKNGGIDFQW